MDSNIIDPENVLVNAEECKRLSYDMLFNDGTDTNGIKTKSNGQNGHANYKSEEQHQRELRQLRKECEQKLEQAKTEAYKQGFNDGKEEGIEEFKTAIDDQVAVVTQAVEDIDHKIQSLTEDLKPHMASMVFDVAEQIIGLPVKNDALKDQVAAELRRILATVENGTKVQVNVAATDYGYIIRALKNQPDLENVSILSSESLNPGEYTVDTQNERVVKDFKKMLDDFREELALEDDITLEVDQ